MEHALEYLTIGVYLTFLLGISIYVSKQNRNVSDYVRGGGQAAWWLVGSSAFMSSISAYTFTANGSLAYMAGPSALIIFVAIGSGLVISAVYIGPWIRQTEAVTFADIIRQRFGPEVEQFWVYFSFLVGPLASSVMLWALAVFCSTVFGFPLIGTILVLGLVVLFYSCTGGRWAVMATDFLQGTILVPISILIAVLCLAKFGGLGGFLAYFERPEFVEDFKFVNAIGEFSQNKFTIAWILAMFTMVFLKETNFEKADKYLSAKDSRSARKSAILSGVLVVIGGPVFLIPAMTARFLFEDQVTNIAIQNPAEAAHAIAAMNVLPNGLTGILVVAMFAATMSSMDTGLNSVTGGIVNNLIPALRRRLKKPPLSELNQIRLCRGITIVLGLIIISYALLFATKPDLTIFDAYMFMNAAIIVPLGLPFAISLFVRKLPRWSYFVIAGAGLAPSIYAYFDADQWTFQRRVFTVVGFSVLATVVCRLLFFTASKPYRERIEAFFTKMHTPVITEGDGPNQQDRFQLNLLGTTSLIASGFLSLLLLVPNPVSGRLAILTVCLFVFSIGMLLKRAARRTTTPAE
ncbi:MAG: Na+:solute symporter [Synoicihabitans sp.]